MRFVGNEKRRVRVVEGLIKSLKIFDTIAESDEDPGIFIDLLFILRR